MLHDGLLSYLGRALLLRTTPIHSGPPHCRFEALVTELDRASVIRNQQVSEPGIRRLRIPGTRMADAGCLTRSYNAVTLLIHWVCFLGLALICVGSLADQASFEEEFDLIENEMDRDFVEEVMARTRERCIRLQADCLRERNPTRCNKTMRKARSEEHTSELQS